MKDGRRHSEGGELGNGRDDQHYVRSDRASERGFDYGRLS
jgi:hypothetical protein